VASREPSIVHLVPAAFGPEGVVGGAERYALELARAMSRLAPTTLVSFGDRARTESRGALQLRVLGPAHYVRGQRANPVSLQLFGALRPATIVHCHQQHVLASSLAALYGRLTGRPVFVTDLGGGGWDVSGYVSTDDWYDGHLHISEYSRRVFGHERDRRARVILGGVDTDLFAPGADAPKGGVLFVGRLLPHKGVDYLIHALPPDMSLTIMGPAPDARYLADLARLAAGKQVTFRHDANDAALLEAYRRALCVVLPSVYRTRYGQQTNVPELLGQTLLEAMACGAVTVATNVASLPEVVDDGVTGFLVPPNDPAPLGARLAWLRDHPEEARRMGQAGRRRVLERFTWDAVVRRCFAAYGVGGA
jgi:glycosyltransferase involved in cell wall biosynthesis